MTGDSITEASITDLVHRFYAKVREDEALGPIFANAIGDDDAQWGPHLQRMVDFWSSIMLTSGRYHGNPFQKHKDLPPFDISLFDRWLILFEETVKELHSDDIAERYMDKARRIAESLKLGLYYKLGRTEQ